MQHEDPSVATLSLDVASLSVDGSTEPPTEFRVFTAGIVDTLKGRFLFDDRAAEDVMSAYEEHGIDLPLDYEHAMVDPFSSPADRVAAGWFRLALRDGELWAEDVRWTPRAAQALRDREWRYISPAFRVDGEDEPMRVRRLTNVAITNLPATKQLRPLVASMGGSAETQNPSEKHPMKTLLKALGLGENATEAEALTAFQQTQEGAQQLCALTDKPTLGEAIAVCSAWKDSAARVAAIEAQLAADRKVAADAKALSQIEDAISGKRLTPASKPVAEKLYADHGAPALEAFLSALPAVVSSQPVTPPEGNEGVVALSAEDREVAKALGLTEAQALKNKRDEIAARNGVAA